LVTTTQRSTLTDVELRDHFAGLFATTLASRIERPEDVAKKAYDLADAMLLERARRGLEDDANEGAWEPEELFRVVTPEEEAFHARPSDPAPWALLDEPAPMSEELDPRWEDLRHDPVYEAEPKWGPPFSSVRRDSDRPGLARTTPERAAPGLADEPLFEGALRKKA
jgi:hypothetical protein